MDLTLIYTVTVLVVFILFYPIAKCSRYLTWRLAYYYFSPYHACHLFFNSFLPSVIGLLPLLLLSIIPGTALFARNIQYPLLLPRKYWMSITRLECIILILYFGANVTMIILEKANIGSIAARLAVINAMPLFLGSHTNPLADFIGIPLSTYYIFHHFIGRVVVIEDITHAMLSFRRSRVNQTTISGYIAFGGLSFLLFTSFYRTRRYFFRSFAKIHLVLAIVTLGATTWHVIAQSIQQSMIILFVSSGIWILTTAYISIRLMFYAARATIIAESSDSEVSRITISCDRHFHRFPGSYFYIFPPGSLRHYNLFSSYPMIVLWYEPGIKPEGSTQLTFLVSHSRPLKSLQFETNTKMLIDGPYGQNLNLNYFQSVMLAAHGAGIIGILSIARALWEQRRDNKTLRKVNIFWSLEKNSQGKWAAPYLKRLQKLDADHTLFVVWCIYPTEKKETAVFNEDDYWLCFYQHEWNVLFPSMMDAMSEESIVVGKFPFPRGWISLTVFIACGDPDFSAYVRGAVIDRRASQPIEFVEAQYRPNTGSSHTMNDADSEKGKDSFNITDSMYLKEGKDKSLTIRSEEEQGKDKLSTIRPEEKQGRDKLPTTRLEESEEWDEVSLSSSAGTLVCHTPYKTWQKRD